MALYFQCFIMETFYISNQAIIINNGYYYLLLKNDITYDFIGLINIIIFKAGWYCLIIQFQNSSLCLLVSFNI